MRVLVLHLADPKISEWAKSLQGALQNHNCQVDLVDTNYAGGAPVSTAKYELVLAMTTFKGLWRPIIPVALDNLLKRCTRLEGKKGAALVASRINSNKALRFLMHLMEMQGMMVEDFAVVRSPKDFPKIAERFVRIGSSL